MLLHYTTRTNKSRRLDSHQHEAVYKTAAFLNRATSAFSKGVRGESNPPPRPSQGHMQNHYTTDTISSPGWIRTSDPSHVTEMSCTLSDGTVIPRPGFEPGTPRSKRGMMVHFTIGVSNGRQGSRTLISVGRTALAERPGQPYPATFHQWTHRGSNPDFQSAELVSSRWTMSPFHSVDREGVAPSFPACGAGVVLLDQQPNQ